MDHRIKLTFALIQTELSLSFCLNWAKFSCLSDGTKFRFPRRFFYLEQEIDMTNFTVHVMLQPGGGYIYDMVPQFFSLNPEGRPLPACLEGTKNLLDLPPSYEFRYNAALFPGEGIVNA